MRPHLEFSHNWNNKTECDYFTTLRLSNRFQVGEWVDIYLNSKYLGPCLIVDKKRLTLSSLNPWICGIDTGYTVPETVDILQRMYNGRIKADTTIYLYLVRKQTKAEKKEAEQAQAAAQTELGL